MPMKRFKSWSYERKMRRISDDVCKMRRISNDACKMRRIRKDVCKMRRISNDVCKCIMYILQAMN